MPEDAKGLPDWCEFTTAAEWLEFAKAKQRRHFDAFGLGLLTREHAEGFAHMDALLTALDASQRECERLTVLEKVVDNRLPSRLCSEDLVQMQRSNDRLEADLARLRSERDALRKARKRDGVEQEEERLSNCCVDALHVLDDIQDWQQAVDTFRRAAFGIIPPDRTAKASEGEPEDE